MNEHIWITNEGNEFKVNEMRIPHIVNILKCWEGKGKLVIPEDYLGGKEKWVKIFKEELANRRKK
jgi:hypothetical protein